MTEPQGIGSPAPEGSEAAPPDRHLDHLRAVYQSLHEPPAPAAPAKPIHAPGAPGAQGHKGRWATWGALGTGLVFLAGKLKFLSFLGAVLKLKTVATMALSVGVYATQWGFPYALGFVLLIFVHELGHAVVMWKEKIPAGAPVFIPFVGAFIAMKGRPRDAYVEAKVAFGGPVLGALASWAVLAAGVALDQPLLRALGHSGALLNLFNLIPVSPLDGGRIAGAFTRGFWVAGYGLGVVALFFTRSPILLLVMLVGLWTLWQRWRHPVAGYDTIPRAKRILVGAGYAALVLSLTLTLGVEPPHLGP